jgi:prophage regulatory protein
MPGTATTSRAIAAPSVQGLPHDKHRAQLADTGDTSSPVPSPGVVPCERLLRLRDVLGIVGMSRAHVYNLIKQGLFPRPVALGSNCARWVQSEVQTWVGDRIVTGRLTRTEQAAPGNRQR